MKSNLRSALRCVLPVVAVGLLAGLTGCSSHVYNVKVDAIQNPEVSTGFSYRILARNSEFAVPDSYHEQAVESVKAVLATRGMYEAPQAAMAEVEVIIDYGVGPQRLKVENYDPDMHPSVARAPLALLPVRQANGRVGYVTIPADQLDVDGTFRGAAVLRGSRVCEKFLTIAVREAPETVTGPRKPAEAWQVHVSVEDARDSLAGYLPILANAATEYLGTSTAGRQRVVLREDTPMVALAKSDR